MSDDLISRKEVVKTIDGLMRSPYANNYPQFAEDRKGTLDIVKTFCKRRLKAAYDLDKVVQEITELQLKIKDKLLVVEDEEFAVMLRGQLRGIADCLEIVKSGGIADE